MKKFAISILAIGMFMFVLAGLALAQDDAGNQYVETGSDGSYLFMLEPGTYIIEEGNLRVIVSEAPAPELEKVKWEAHRDFSDIQYIVKGKAQMGVAPVSEATVTEAYDGT